ncbi:MFS transporter [Pararobbsia silviterrae]|uniref:MFS transporter n=1 Tax=Pararobbsia silviterrae TaxID=1792498 RepID=A0A494X467_9BURK|nr:MFS transporter [Pararobbsia silviterrae]RKP44441.1 MFS transporter [Pararobbsia silviterrae]
MSYSADTALAGSTSPTRAAMASLVGAIIDWYDFYVYGLVAALVFPRLFFPSTTSSVGVLLTFATLGVGFVVRPLGGVIFGHFGDKVGRKAMLVGTLVLMGGGTVLVGLLPTYDQIGIAAPIILVALRLVQGFAVGGEWGGAALMAIEHCPENRRGFFGSFVQVGSFVGLLLATGSVSLIDTLTTEAQFLSWGWRLPFLLSVVVIFAGYWVRRSVSESPEFEQEVSAGRTEAIPLVAAIRAHPSAFLVIVAMRLCELVSFYGVTVFALNYGIKTYGIPRSVLLHATIVVGFVAIVLCPTMGALSDRIGRRPIYVLGALIGALGAFPLFWALQSQNPLWICLGFVLVGNFCCNLVICVQQPLFTEMFAPAFRYSGAGFAYQLASAIIGGLTPLVSATLSMRDNGGYTYVAVYMCIACLVSAATGLLAGRRSNAGATAWRGA